MQDDDLKKLDMRISRIENLLEQAVSKREMSDISAEELASYRKVRDTIAADWGDFCGINDCFRCIIVRCLQCQLCNLCRPCDVECVCGPCGLGRYGGNLRRFQDLGY